MKLIVGLGNPGEEYRLTRHNVGFLVLEEFAKLNNIKFRPNKRFNALTGEGLVAGENIYLAMPQAFMNLSGHSVRPMINWLNVETSGMIVVLDDASLPFGSIRIRPQGSDAGHKGLGSIIDSLATKDIPRMRIGIMGKSNIKDLSHYVLADFTKTEQKKLPDILENASAACECWGAMGIETAMNRFNTTRRKE